MKFFILFVICVLNLVVYTQAQTTVFVAEKLKTESDDVFVVNPITPLEITITEDELSVKESAVYLRADVVKTTIIDGDRATIFSIFEGKYIQAVIRYDRLGEVTSIALISTNGTVFTYLNTIKRC